MSSPGFKSSDSTAVGESWKEAADRVVARHEADYYSKWNMSVCLSVCLSMILLVPPTAAVGLERDLPSLAFFSSSF